MSINTNNCKLRQNKFGIYFIKFRVSVSLSRFFNKQFITKTLSTKNINEAKIKADIIRTKYLELLRVVHMLNDKQIKELVNKYIIETLEQDKNDRVEYGYGLVYSSADDVMFPDDASASRDVIKEHIGECKLELANNKFNMVGEIGKKLLASIDVTYDKNNLTHNKFLHQLLIGQIEILEEVCNRYKGVYNSKYEKLSPSTSVNEEVDLLTFEEAYNKFIKWYKKTDIQEIQFNTVNKRLNLALDYFGRSTNIKRLTTDDVEEYIDFLSEYPIIRKNPYRNMTYEEIVNLDAIPKEDSISTSTLIKYIKAFRQMENFLVDDGALERKISKRATLPTADSVETQIFTDEDLKFLFTEFDFVDDKKLIYYTFAYSGMRTSEFWKCKVNKEGDVYYFDLEYEGVNLKTKSSKRKIPIHKELIRLGIVEKLTQLQNEFSQTRVSTSFNNNLIPKLSHPENKFLYGFRHTVATVLKRNDVEIDKISEILGHAYSNNNMTRAVYASRYNLEQLKAAIDKLDY